MIAVDVRTQPQRQEWLAARLDLLAKEKAASRRLAALAEQRRALPAVAIEKDYVFEGPDGKMALIDLFEGRSQLIVYHFMWLHDIDEGCPSCSFAIDDMPDPIHLNEGADTTLALVSSLPRNRPASSLPLCATLKSGEVATSKVPLATFWSWATTPEISISGAAAATCARAMPTFRASPSGTSPSCSRARRICSRSPRTCSSTR